MKIIYYLAAVMTIAFLSCEQKSTRTMSENIVIPPEHISRTDTLDLLLKQAGLEHRKVFMVLGFTGCGGCKLFEKYHNDPGVKAILNKYFIVTYIDYKKTRGGKELYARYASTAAPSWTIFDPDGNVLVNSDAPVPGIKDTKANIGYPSGKREIEYYLNALKHAAPAIDGGEYKLLTAKLIEYNKN